MQQLIIIGDRHTDHRFLNVIMSRSLPLPIPLAYSLISIMEFQNKYE